MQPKKSILSVALLFAASSLGAQVPTMSSRLANDNSEGGSYRPAAAIQQGSVYGGPFSRIAIGGSFNTLGPGIQITTNLADHFNLRATGNAFRYSTTFNSNGFDANAKMSMTNAALAADIYPFHLGFRVSPGIMLLNNNRVSANALAAGGTSFTFNDTTYYSANANAAFTLTTGWGNTIPRNGHLSFPFEVGVAFVGAPSVNVTLAGWACQDEAQTQCGDVTDPTNTTAQDIQTNLAAQITKWKSDLDPLKTYPVLSFGVAYSFPLRGGSPVH